MRSRRWAHVLVVVATAGVAGRSVFSAPVKHPEANELGTLGSGSGSAKPAGSATLEANEIPDWRAGPAKFAVAPFENHSSVKVLDWIIAGGPFEIAEKTEGVLGLTPTGGPLYVGGAQVLADPVPVAAFAAQEGATFVVTGWFDRPNWKLRLDIMVWKIAGGVAVVAGEGQRTGEPATYHQLLGDALAEAWTRAGVAVSVAQRERLQRALAIDVYAVNLMGRGLGHLTGALEKVDLKAAEKDLERSVIIDPKCFEAQRVLGELYLAMAPGDAKAASKATGKFNYANDLAPDDLASLRAAAMGAARANKHELALELFGKLVKRQPWDLDARFQLGNAAWALGQVALAQHQLEQVTAHAPDQLTARRVLVLIHASRSDTRRLVAELEAIAVRAPDDLEIKADLATGYGALGQWDRAATALEAIAAARPPDLALLVRIGDSHRKQKDLDAAIAWYTRAAKQAPESSLPGFAIAQALFDAGKYGAASRAYIGLQKYREDLPAAESALGAIAFIQNRPNDAAWYLRRATREAPRSLPTWQALIAAELARKDTKTALADLDAAFEAWPGDGALHYLAGIAHALVNERVVARAELAHALAIAPDMGSARGALEALDAGGIVTLQFVPQLVRPWGDAEQLADKLDHYAATQKSMATARVAYQTQLLAMLGLLNLGPDAKPRRGGAPGTCPIGDVAPAWAIGFRELQQYERLGVELELAYRYLMRHDEAGVTAGLLPNARTEVATAKRDYRLALADVAELRAEWTRSLMPELHRIGCNDKLLAAAVADPAHYHVVEEDHSDAIPKTAPPRSKAHATFYVDNTNCPDAVAVWIDGAQIGEVAPGRRSALVADAGERGLCLIGPSGAQCGDRGTVRQVYLHDGWSVTLHCPK